MSVCVPRELLKRLVGTQVALVDRKCAGDSVNLLGNALFRQADGLLAGAVIQNQQLQIGVLLLLNGSELLPQPDWIRPIHGHHHRDQGQFFGRRRAA
ncbi:hypothetical protein SDC9_78894 [bioreactor metagenome]|uniref:Uncharacterized protein n=1 Tax=bioreactor metagenome TaxID=1076179 RepID=A0A644YV24_9ZZZZ